MANSLNDKLKNDYSTKYSLVVDNDSFYPLGSTLNSVQYSEKIAESNTQNQAYPSKVDPFRQALGKMWTKESGGGATVRFYDPYLGASYFPNGGNTTPNLTTKQTFVPNTYALPEQAVKYEDVTDLWGQYFEKGSYSDSLSLQRKATRMKIEFQSGDLVQDRLTMLSMVSDITKKAGDQPAYSSTYVDPGLKLPELIEAESALELAKEQLPPLQQQLQELQDKYFLTIAIYNALKENLGDDLTGPGINALFVSAYIASEEFAEAIPGYTQQEIGEYFFAEILPAFEVQKDSPGGFSKFGDWYEDLIAQINSNEIFPVEEQISDLENQIQELEQTTIPNLEEENENYISNVVGDYNSISFEPQDNNTTDYNYNSNLEKEVLFNEKRSLLEPFGEFQSDLILALFDNTFGNVVAATTNQSLKDSRIDSFYNPITDTYSYDDFGGYTGRYYTDSAFSMSLPMSSKAQALVNDENKSQMYIDIVPTYNFYSRYYEQATIDFVYRNKNDTAQPDIVLDETWLPILYEVPLEDENSSEANPAPTTEDPFSKFYFEKFGHTILNCDLGISFFTQKYGTDREDNFNIIIDQSDVTYLNKYDSLKNKFPFYVNFQFKADENKDFATLFSQTGVTGVLLDTLISNFFFYNKKGSQVTDVSKDSLIGDIAGDNAFKYYDPMDPDPEYGSLTEGAPAGNSAEICKKGIYRIRTKKDFYKTVPPTTTADAVLVSDLIHGSAAYNVREFDLNKFLSEYVKAFTETDTPLFAEITSPFFLEIVNQTLAKQSSKFFKSSNSDFVFLTTNLLSSLIELIPKYQQLVHEKLRNYDAILNKETAYNETLFYRIQKVAVDSVGDVAQGGLVQNIWMIKSEAELSDEQEIMRYIDTQVRYGQRYEYTVYAYQLVVGTKYGFHFESSNEPGSQLGVNMKFQEYLNGFNNSAANTGYSQATDDIVYSSGNGTINRFYKPGGNTSDRLAMFDVICESDVKLVEMPIYKKVAAISDAPPMSPEVDIVPLNGKQNDIKINFYPGSVSREMVPIPLNLVDRGKFFKNRQAQERDLFTQEYASKAGLVSIQSGGFPSYYFVEPRLKFKSDDFVTHYEIYRLESPPEQYLDFVDNLLETISSQNQSSYTDKIEHNKKYYYMFRSIDVHENISNPSPVYQVEMVENSGAIYPVISIYNFEQESENVKTKSFKRLLKISAASAQEQIDLSQSQLENADSALDAENQSVYLGAPGNKLFNSSAAFEIDSASHKKFKFRIRSKHTGKVIDLNVKFKLKKNTINETVPSCGDAAYVEQNYAEAGSDVEHEGAGSDGGGNNEGHGW